MRDLPHTWLAAGLRRAGSAWGNSHDDARMAWLLSCRETTNVPELAQLLCSLEVQVPTLALLPLGPTASTSIPPEHSVSLEVAVTHTHQQFWHELLSYFLGAHAH